MKCRQKTFSDIRRIILISFTMSGTILLSSCGGGIPPTVILNVPFAPQWYQGWCGPANIEMWANYQNLWPNQKDIATAIGWYGTNIYALADGVSLYTHNNGYAGIYGSSEYEQDRAMSAQVSSIHNNTPSISIVDGGFHSVIIMGCEWDYVNMWQKRAKGFFYHDPYLGPNFHSTANVWKHGRFSAYYGNHLVVLGYGWFAVEGDMGYSEFLNQGGTYYGGPSEYFPAI